jgi:hypothetical protein
VCCARAAHSQNADPQPLGPEPCNGAPASPPALPQVTIKYLSEAERRRAPDCESGRERRRTRHKSQTKDITSFSGPIRAWYSIGAKGIFGRLERSGPNNEVVVGAAGSRLGSGVSIALMSVLVIADGRKMAGYEIGPVSDYIAMLILSRAPVPDKCAGLDSILDLLATQCDRGDAPQGLTQADLAFLKALYSTDLELVGGLHKSNIHDIMLRSLVKH